ncbi:hypothetical protein FBD94_22475 [Pedobacter hiemivivus]|uniref:ApeA N-terminal domain-containing protein n=1 Tax=Pedobacter hiemivivus TaxID=2530454 RepID=A0A4U1G1W0_9SPHI|nr:hypothetical protein [Pedobacter hiemivivus]TKC56490.1 hypothetical protein FBD94_22475 [Pedobacter hiemivivus]
MDIINEFPDAIVKDVHWSIESIKSFQDEKVGKIEKSDFPISECTAIIQKDGIKGYTFKIILNKIYDYTYNQDLQKYGILDGIRLTINGSGYVIDADGAKNVEISLSDPQVLTLWIAHIQRGEISDFDKRLLRLVIPIKADPQMDLIEYSGLRIGSNYTPAGLIEVSFNKKSYHVFKYEHPNTDDNYLIIDGLEPDDFAMFQHNTIAIITAMGFVSGDLYLDEYFYHTLDKDENYKVDYMCYQQMEESAITNQAILDPLGFQQYVEATGQSRIVEQFGVDMKKAVFSSLCQKIAGSLEFSRCCKLMIEGNQSKQMLLRAGIYSIALETITGIINDQYEDKVNPIADKKLSKTIIDKMLSTLQEYDAFLDDYGLEILKSKLKNLNSPTNAKKLSKPFEIYGVNLTKEDLDILNHRNKFLHGTSPFSEDELPGKTLELGLIVARLWFLLNVLMLKYAGYSGHIKNLPALILFRRKKNPEESLYKII